jgi:hypothetical protein
MQFSVVRFSRTTEQILNFPYSEHATNSSQFSAVAICATADTEY